METILATAFGRQVDLQMGESDQLSKSMGLLVGGFTSGQVEKFILLESKPRMHLAKTVPCLINAKFCIL